MSPHALPLVIGSVVIGDGTAASLPELNSGAAVVWAAGKSIFRMNNSWVNSMHASWKLRTDMWDLSIDAQRVIAMRLARISAGGRAADVECRLMVSEKIAAGCCPGCSR
jgi:hypothetical protein